MNNQKRKKGKRFFRREKIVTDGVIPALVRRGGCRESHRDIAVMFERLRIPDFGYGKILIPDTPE